MKAPSAAAPNAASKAPVVSASAPVDDSADDAPITRHGLRRLIGTYAVFPILILVLAVSQVEDGSFLTWGSAKTLLSQNASLGIIAVGLTFVLIGGGMDISVGSTFAFGACVYAKLGLDSSLFLALIAAIAVGMAAGFLNGLLIARLNLSPFVTTLGTSSLLGGLVVVYAGNNAITPSSPAFGHLGNNTLFGTAYSVWILAVVMLVAGLILHRTSFGKSLFAIGGSPGASRLAGLRIRAFRWLTYVISGGCAGLAGAVYASQTGAGQSNVGGDTVALTALAMVVLGGTSLFGGEGAMWRTVIGFLILASVTTLFTVLAIDQSIQDLVEGGIVVVALILDSTARGRAQS